MHHLLLYDLADDYLARRPEFRAAHLALIRAAHERGNLVLAGALADPVDGAVLVFRSAEAAEQFARSDPNVSNGLITRWRVRTWMTVVGDGATPP